MLISTIWHFSRSEHKNVIFRVSPFARSIYGTPFFDSLYLELHKHVYVDFDIKIRGMISSLGRETQILRLEPGYRA